MTRREREVTDIDEILAILDKCLVVHIGMTDGEQPYVVPMNFGYTYEQNELVLYVHGAVKGYKYDLIAVNPKVCVEMECDLTPFQGKIACQYGMAYACLMGRGTAKLVEEPEEKMKALSILMKCQTGKDFVFDEKLVSIVNVMKISVADFSAKRRLVPAELQKQG